ncbi:hypothetical protein [Pseudomonas syringae group genomosp. 7]|uniref:hypothetical protein n=1 Tax=Pseudomonas syringae group genomosp. 7 TaxID=251699 RepID=UPI000EFEA650|nr:hypothetical protein [Pseudomonas syringae group genomosp. 7]RMW17481.1 hypothetical protein ALO98_200244 [Pseudomonas syringae pv. tagetis]
MDFIDSKGNTFALSSHDKKVQHTMIIGGGKGRSLILEAEAKKRGITVEELEALTGPTDEEKEQIRLQNELTEARDAKRLLSVCQAYWDHTSPSSGERDEFHDTLIAWGFTNHPSEEQQKALLFMLPQHIVGHGIAWGFEDTDVRSQIHDFISENKEAIAVALKNS